MPLREALPSCRGLRARHAQKECTGSWEVPRLASCHTGHWSASGRRGACSEASCHSSGWESHQHRSPVDVVVISNNGKGDWPVESLDVKGAVGRETGQIRTGRRANWQAAATCEPWKPRNLPPAGNGFAGILGVPSRCSFGEGLCRHHCLELIDVELPGVVEDGMSGKNGQRKPGTSRGSPRRSRTAKASHISRCAVKLRCACEWDGWGRLSDDGSGQQNPDRSEDL